MDNKNIVSSDGEKKDDSADAARVETRHAAQERTLTEQVLPALENPINDAGGDINTTPLAGAIDPVCIFLCTVPSINKLPYVKL